MANAALRAELHDVSFSIRELQWRLKNVQTRLDPTTYPVLTLPPEITSEIFLRCLPKTRELDVVNPREAPLLLTHVCSAWRQIACSTPRLWTTFYITEKHGYLDDLANIAETWFTRAGKCALSVKFHGSVTNETDFVSLLPGLRRHAREVRSLELNADVSDLVMMNPPLECVSLQKLTIGVLGGLEDLPEYSPLEMFTNGVPLLREVLMRTAPPSFLALPWQQLTKFAGEMYTVGSCLEALRAMPNLTECAFAAYYRADDAEMVYHPNIQHFTLFGRGSGFVSDATNARILAHITLPALRTLEIKDVHDFNQWTLDSFLIRSAARLWRLVVRPWDMSSSIQLQLSAPFMALPLTELEIWHPSDLDVFLAAFFKAIAQDVNTLPSLRSLSFRGCDRVKGGIAVDAIIGIAAVPITQRRHLAGCAQLQSFHVVSKTHPEVSVYAEARLLPFRELKEAGMDIYIGSEEESVV
ncbi:hypothetical protein C8F04DRAFT_1027150 [Mycena alexandri]|uniref:F-box domain-containing protein n=1 Tax=Mycena alexandri TaxID=1745969 RepID=A0AAD6TIC1_9AGAR|nr:hypothetical protein C8F04DRAFT_1027150 [Mycena alexandri]